MPMPSWVFTKTVLVRLEQYTKGSLLRYNSRALLNTTAILVGWVGARAVGRRTEGLKRLMDAEKLDHFRKILLEQLRLHADHVRQGQADALESADDGVKDSVDMSLQDVNQEIMLRLGERESQMVADIDQALMRIDEGTYGECARCGKQIDERRLEAMPTARYDAACQAIIEARDGLDDIPTL
jgi:DnaK suppressor protein